MINVSLPIRSCSRALPLAESLTQLLHTWTEAARSCLIIFLCGKLRSGYADCWYSSNENVPCTTVVSIARKMPPAHPCVLILHSVQHLGGLLSAELQVHDSRDTHPQEVLIPCVLLLQCDSLTNSFPW